jgi:multicomponent Na+:H+ antiporter subunit G
MNLLDLASWILLASGGLFCLVGALGMLRLPDLYTRLHGASLIETLGAGAILMGLALQAGFTLITAKLVIIGLLIFFASPTATHALAKAALARRLMPQVADADDLRALDEEPPSTP